mmetsp:Transcript_28543/g.50712  ORF Transcript_28543/g.50712 Transcript_28543/m.50712 type:complete len:315 (+) Transcript_28543:916-1860(+)
MVIEAQLSAIGSILISAWFMAKHLKHYSSPHLQVHILRILLIVPVVAFSSLISLVGLQSNSSMEAIRSCYEGYALYQFKHLIVEYVGSDQKVLDLFENRQRVESFLCIGPKKFVLSPQFYRRVNQGILQFVIVRPVTGLIAAALDRYSISHHIGLSLNSAYLSIAFVNNLSVSVSLYCLVLLYSILHDQLQPHQPLQKFLCIKGLLFFAFWQNCLVELMLRTGLLHDTHQCEKLQSSLLCYESVFFALAFSLSFSYKEFQQPVEYEPIIKSISNVLSMNDVIKDINHSFMTSASSYHTELEPLEDAPLITNLST